MCPGYDPRRSLGEASELLVPEAFDKSRAASLENVTPSRFQPRGCAEGVQPERLDFDRFSDARCDYTVAHPRVHPGELQARDASRQQAVRVHPDTESSAGGIAVYDLLDRGLEGSPLCCRQKRRVVRDELQQLVDRDDLPEGCVDGVELGRLAMIGDRSRNLPSDTAPAHSTRMSRASASRPLAKHRPRTR